MKILKCEKSMNFGTHPSIDSNSVISNSAMYFLDKNTRDSRTCCMQNMQINFSSQNFYVERNFITLTQYVRKRKHKISSSFFYTSCKKTTSI